ncbi:hypothetical protein DXG01_013408 [Tephrocybe rancida]|nr:hypothetical protein DXG01_013408 [Tephrocybe rancida]
MSKPGFAMSFELLFIFLVPLPFVFCVHLVLFCICVYLLATRRSPAHLIILVSIIVMFALSVADIAISYRLALRDIPAVLKQEMNLVDAIARAITKGYLFVSNKSYLSVPKIYRCFKVWNNRKIILVAAGVVLVADSVWGYISMDISILKLAAAFTPVFYWSIVAFNIAMTLVTAGRIWWVARTVQPLLDTRQAKKYNTAFAIILESGAIYPLVVLILAATPSNKAYAVFTIRTCSPTVTHPPSSSSLSSHASYFESL